LLLLREIESISKLLISTLSSAGVFQAHQYPIIVDEPLPSGVFKHILYPRLILGSQFFIC